MSIDIIPIKSLRGKNTFSSYAAIDSNNGQLHIEFTQFIHWFMMGKNVRYNSKTRQTYPRQGTLYQYTYKLKFWFDWIQIIWNPYIEEQIKKNNPDVDENLICNWRSASPYVYDKFFQYLHEQGTEPITRNIYRTVLCLFYDEFCKFMDISHSLNKLSQEVPQNYNKHSLGKTNILSGIGRAKSKTHTVPKGYERTIDKTTYNVITTENLTKLNTHFEDPVYALMSYWGLITGLRISPIVNTKYPGKCPDNPLWLVPAEMRAEGINGTFEFVYVYKGETDTQYRRNITVSLHAWETIWKAYKPLLDERVKLWRTKFNQGSRSYPDCLWLTKVGKPVTTKDYQEAVKNSRNIIRKQNKSFPIVTPRWLRNTFACGIISNYCKKLGIEIDLNNEAQLLQIHLWVKDLLGHQSLDTTMRYLRTIKTYVNRRLLPELVFNFEQSDLSITSAHITDESLESIFNNLDWIATYNEGGKKLPNR
ncbi:site-specific integrase [Vibrio diazotrophicus]|uniref:Uncharacterized protein n=1 Tax=Vibrio diazotrophicus TaxID=685 RepID=A0ABX4W479_VIBDI|nr:site-specific integrase [Vibrio diazotrophicus]PNH96537.1 hypothetical protein C1O25_21455 [Vibrio diazotrophicus]